MRRFEKHSLYQWLAIWLGLLLSTTFVSVAFLRVDLDHLRRVLIDATLLPWLPAAVFAYLLGHGFRGLRCRSLVRHDVTLSPITATNIVAIGYAFNNLFPSRLGEIVRSGMLAQRSGLPFVRAVTVTLLERVLDGLVIVFLLFVSSQTFPLEGNLAIVSTLATVLLISATIVIALLLLLPSSVLNTSSRLAGRFAPARHDLLVQTVAHISHALAILRQPREAIRILALTLVIWCLETLMFLSVMFVFGLDKTFLAAAFVMAVTNIGILPPSTPGYIGHFHYFCLSSLMVLDVHSSTAAAVALVVHLSFYIPITLWGALATAWYGVEVGSGLAWSRAAKRLGGQGEPGPERILGRRPFPPASSPSPSPTLTQLVDTFVRLAQLDLPASLLEPHILETSRFVHGQIEALPFRLRLLHSLGMYGVFAVVLIVYGRRFSELSIEQRCRVIKFLAFGPISLTRQLFRLVRSSSLLAFFESPLVLRHLQHLELNGATSPDSSQTPLEAV